MIYDTDRTYLSEGSTFVADEAYATPVGALQATLDAVTNEQSIFTNLIMNDFRECAANHADNREQAMNEFYAFQEASVGSIWRSFIELLKKIGAKIKAIFEKFIAKLTALFTKDTSKLVKKYEKQVYANDYSKMVFKGYKAIKNYETPMDLDVFTDISLDKFNGMNDVQAMEKAVTTKIKFMGLSIGAGEIKDEEAFRKKLDEEMFEKESDREGLVKSDMSKIIAILNNTKLTKNVKDQQTKIERSLSDLKKKAETAERKMAEQDAKKEGRDLDIARSTKCITELNNASAAVTAAFQAFTSNTSKVIAQSKKAFIMAATYSPKKAVNASFIFDEAQADMYSDGVLAYFEEF